MAVLIQLPFKKLFFNIAIPDPQTGPSPAMCLFGGPILPDQNESDTTLNKREEVLRNNIYKLLKDGPFTLGNCHHSL